MGKKNKHLKVPLLDKSILKTFSIVVAFISSLVGVLAISIPFDRNYWWVWIAIWFPLLLLIYIFIFAYANKKKEASFKINGTNVKVFVGDIFSVEDGLAVIPMNEYFDTQVDDVVISKTSLHGKYLLNVCKDVAAFENLVKSKLTPLEVNKDRKVTNHQNRYDLGSLIENEGYVLTAFTKFDENNKAYLYGKDYLYFWGSFWSNIDAVFAGRTVNIPLFGSGMTRLKDYNQTKQELLENILITMRKTGFKNKYPDKSVNIIIYEGDADEIDFYHLKERVGD